MCATAKAMNVSKSKWIAGVIKEKLVDEWPAAVKELSGAWRGFSPLEDIRNWGIDQVDEVTRREIFVAQEGTINRIFGVNLHDLDELGENQEYELYFENTLSGSPAAAGGAHAVADVEIVVGLNLSTNSSFVHPVVMPLEVFEDDELFRRRKAGFWAWTQIGFAVLDNRTLILGSF